ncbi:MAG TPA: MoaD/ThiS family protein [Solirubrobacterales bacterium]|nr:MoaD/ThiS family protein [Solirubrobacterales bacterium]
MEAKDILALVIAAVGAVIALGSLVQASFEYVKRGRMERMQVFFDLRRRLKEPELGRIAELIDEARTSSDEEKSRTAERRLADISLRKKRDYLGLFEEVGLAMEKGLIEPEIAHYMFGYYALHCVGCDAFWIDVGRWNPYWDRFYEFCERMEAEREAFERGRDPRRKRPVVLGDEIPSAIAARDELAGETPTVYLKLPGALRLRTGTEEFVARGKTVGEALECLVDAHPELRWFVFCKESDLNCEPTAINPYVNVYRDGEDIKFVDGIDTVVEVGDRIHLVPASSGG